MPRITERLAKTGCSANRFNRVTIQVVTNRAFSRPSDENNHLYA
jgi:hypothetical protein